ncbi:MAG: hypothetical protein EOP39_04600 [Rubrivivax sp.]|nr:MAG: hypothetical protein EOP39_04600 [Rubrivivax sp.]
MTFDYDKTAATAARLLAKFGAPVTVARVTPGAYDPETGTNGAGSSETWSPSGVKLDYTAKEIDGTLILAGDQRVYMSAVAGLDPQPGDAVTLGADVWRVVKSRTLAPAGVAVLLDVQCRKG